MENINYIDGGEYLSKPNNNNNQQEFRRGSDPSEVKKGPINSIVPNPPKVPSHQDVYKRQILSNQITLMLNPMLVLI